MKLDTKTWSVLHWLLFAGAVVLNGTLGTWALQSEVSAAYIDPGIGAMLVQILVAAFFGLLFYAKRVRQAIARFFIRLTGRSGAEKPGQSLASQAASIDE